MQRAAGIRPRLTLLLATSCGLIAANIYRAQPLIGPISASLSMMPGGWSLTMWPSLACRR